MSDTVTAHAGVEIRGPVVLRAGDILTDEAVVFVAELQRRFGHRRNELLARRTGRRAEAARTGRLDFLPDTAQVRSANWAVAPAPPDLVDRRVEITGPPEPKMAINALNSGAKVWLADLEDANTPALVQRHRRAGHPVRRHPPPTRVHRARGQGLPAGHRPTACGHHCPAPRVAFRRTTPARRRRTGRGGIGRFRVVLLPQRHRADQPGQRPVLL